MKQIIEFPHTMWISQYTIRFAFDEVISQENFQLVQQFNRFLKKCYIPILLKVLLVIIRLQHM